MTKEEIHIDNKIRTCEITVEKIVSSCSCVRFNLEKVCGICLGTALGPTKIIISLYHELGHFKFLKSKIIRKIMYFCISRNRYKWFNYYNKKPHLVCLYTFLTYLWEIPAWWDAKKELQKTEFWNFEMRKTFFEYKKYCLKAYLGYK